MNCPERRNALSEAHMRELIAVFGAAELTLTLRRLPQPVVAKVQGLATAAGCRRHFRRGLCLFGQISGHDQPRGTPDE
jgi:enoyl-CoA hydratase/carnithine racemase